MVLQGSALGAFRGPPGVARVLRCWGLGSSAAAAGGVMGLPPEARGLHVAALRLGPARLRARRREGQPGASPVAGPKRGPTASGQGVSDHALGERGPGQHVLHPVPRAASISRGAAFRFWAEEHPQGLDLGRETANPKKKHACRQPASSSATATLFAY
jgi:hypothetical protein